MKSPPNLSPITERPVTMSVEWTDRAAHQRIRVEYDDDAARFLARVDGDWTQIQEARRPRAGAKFDLSAAHPQFREEVRRLERLERDGFPEESVIVDDPVEALRERRARA
jgi:hypothetical protein